jgi:hypothetical protein
MTRFTALSLALLLLVSPGCKSPPSNYTVVSTSLDKHPDSTEFTKVFALNSDLHGNGWVMRKGTKIAFNSDGSAVLDTVVYAQEGLQLPNAIQLEAIQYGPDGNVQFSVPGNDVGHSLHLRHPRRDYPYSVRFGYKRAYFPALASCKFACRLLTEPGPQTIAAGSGK